MCAIHSINVWQASFCAFFGNNLIALKAQNLFIYFYLFFDLNSLLKSKFIVKFLSVGKYSSIMFRYNAVLKMSLFTLLSVYCSFSVAKDISVTKNIFVPMDISKWEYKGDHFSCLLNQNIKNFGEVTFIAEPSHKVWLKVTSFRLPQPAEQAGVYVLRSPYKDSNQRELVTPSAVIKKHQLIFEHSIAGLLSALSQGAWMQLVVVASDHQLSVQIPSVRISKSMESFSRCRAALPALSFKQARDTELHYQLGQRTVNAEQKTSLFDLAEYVQLDKKVKLILIDGHTDNVGSSAGNIQISRVRADDVASILEAAGVRSDLIEVRAHGARYPVANNNTELGKAKNRRVTIRVIRAEGKK